jgi:hypothetical protein
MSTYLTRQRYSRAKFDEARKIVSALAAAAKNGNGIYAPSLPGQQPRRAQIMQWLREMGVPVMARKAGHSSYWFIVSMFPDNVQKALAFEWNVRVLQHHYAEACRGHMALRAHPHTKAGADMFQRHAVEIGSLLGLALTDIIDDLASTPMDTTVEAEFGQYVIHP